MTTKIEVELQWQDDHLFVGNVLLAFIYLPPGRDCWVAAHCLKAHPMPALSSNIRCEKAFREEVELWAMEALGAKRSFYVEDSYANAEDRWWSVRHQSDTDNST